MEHVDITNLIVVAVGNSDDDAVPRAGSSFGVGGEARRRQ
jgi:hypothetical protein